MTMMSNEKITQYLRNKYHSAEGYEVIHRTRSRIFPELVQVIIPEDHLNRHVGLYEEIPDGEYIWEVIVIADRLKPYYKARVMLHEMIHWIASYLPREWNYLVDSMLDGWTRRLIEIWRE